MKKQIALGVLIVAVLVLASCSSSPTPVTHDFGDYGILDKSDSVSYSMNDQQAFGLAKAWIMTKNKSNVRPATLLTDEIASGVLVGEGQDYDHSWRVQIFLTDGTARIDYHVYTYQTLKQTIPSISDTYWVPAQAAATRNAEKVANDIADREINAFRSAMTR
jgi:hypothetical protein